LFGIVLKNLYCTDESKWDTQRSSYSLYPLSRLRYTILQITQYNIW